jgi:hypothetical protein
VGCLPVGLQRWIVRRYTKNLDPHAFEATLALFQRQTARNAFFLAQHEFRDLAAPADWWLLEQFGALIFGRLQMHASEVCECFERCLQIGHQHG